MMAGKQYTPQELSRLETTREMASEGMVLLRNDGTLPFPAGKHLAVFGTGQIQFLTGGSGSGATRSNFTITLPQALAAAGAELEPGLLQAYQDFCAGQDALKQEARAHNIFRMTQSTGEMPVSQALLAGAAAYTDTAVYVLTRMAGEGED